MSAQIKWCNVQAASLKISAAQDQVITTESFRSDVKKTQKKTNLNAILPKGLIHISF